MAAQLEPSDRACPVCGTWTLPSGQGHFCAGAPSNSTVHILPEPFPGTSVTVPPVRDLRAEAEAHLAFALDRIGFALSPDSPFVEALERIARALEHG